MFKYMWPEGTVLILSPHLPEGTVLPVTTHLPEQFVSIPARAPTLSSGQMLVSIC